VLRAAAGGMYEQLGDADKPEYLDDSAQFGMGYQYAVLAFADEKQQSVVSEPFAVPTLVDIFPPEVPAGVAAVAGVNTIELEWERNTEADFKGYNVFRSVDGGSFEKVAPLIDAPTYSDTNVQPGKTYRYAVSSVDLLGNESARSAPVQASLP
jgi:fibronectin type 3 domain-containing protein